MPGGRNGSAIYNLYKLKYKKTRRLQALCETILRENARGLSPLNFNPTPVPVSGCSLTSVTQPLNLSSKPECRSENEVVTTIPNLVQAPKQNKNLIQVTTTISFTAFFESK